VACLLRSRHATRWRGDATAVFDREQLEPVIPGAAGALATLRGSGPGGFAVSAGGSRFRERPRPGSRLVRRKMRPAAAAVMEDGDASTRTPQVAAKRHRRALVRSRNRRAKREEVAPLESNFRSNKMLRTLSPTASAKRQADLGGDFAGGVMLAGWDGSR